jgi:hypothetical protein
MDQGLGQEEDIKYPARLPGDASASIIISASGMALAFATEVQALGTAATATLTCQP